MASIKKSLSLLLSLLMILGIVVLPSPVSAEGKEEAKEVPYKVKTIDGKDYKVYKFKDVFGAPAPKKQMRIGALDMSEPRITGAVRGSDPALDEEIPSAEWRMVDVQWTTYDLQPPQMGTPIYFQIADFNNDKIIAQTHEVTGKGKYKFYKLPAWNDSDVTHDPNEWYLIFPDSFKFDVRIKTGLGGDFAASNVTAIVAQKGMPLYRAEYFTNGTIPTIEAQRRNPGNKTLTVKINETNLGEDEYYSFALPIGSGIRRPTYEGRKIEVKHYGSDNDDALKVSDAGGAARVKMAMKAPGKTEFDRGPGTFEDNGTSYHYEVTGDYLHPHIFTIRQDLKVNFDANGGTWKTAAPEAQTIGHSMKLADEWAGLGPITVPGEKDLTPPAAEAGKPNKKFIGWNTDKDATTALFKDAADYKEPITDDTTFYAIYEDIAQGTIEVKYVDENGKDLDTKLLMENQFKEDKKLVPELKDNADKTIAKADAQAKVNEVLKDNKPAPVFVGYKFKEVEAADTLTYKKDSFDTVKFVYEKLEDIIEDKTPDTDDDKPDGYKTVTFLPGEHGTLEGATKYYVNPKAEKTLADVDKPTVTANEGYKFIGWDKEDTTAITDNLEVTAQYKKKVVTENPNDEDYVKVDFAAGAHGKIADDATKKYWVLKNEKVTLVAPAVTANEGWEQKAGAEGWDKPLTASYKVDTTITAQYQYNGKDIVPQPGEDKPNVPDNFVLVEFLPGANGTLEGTTKYWVNPDANKTLADVTKPTVKANEGFKHTGWDKADTTAITDALEVTAQYKAKVVTEDPNDTDYVKVSFETTKGTVEGTKAYWVLKDEKVKFDVPTVNMGEITDYAFKAWDPAVAESYAEDTVHKATFNYAGEDIVPQPGEDKPNVPDNFVLVEFLPGEHGTLEGTTKYWVNPDANKTLADVKKPTVTANEGFKHTGWDKADTTAITEALKVTAEYGELKSEQPKIDQPTEGDDKITGEGVPGSKIVVKDKDGNPIGETTVDKDGKWEVPVPEDKPLKENDKITAEQTEKDKTPNTDETTVKGKEQSSKPIVDKPSKGDDKITGKGVPGSKIVVKDKDDNPIGETTVDKDGKWEVPVPEDKPIKDGDKFIVTQEEKDKKPSDPVTVTVTEEPKPEEPKKRDDYINLVPVGETEAPRVTDVHAIYLYGYPGNTVQPQGNMTRAEAAAMVARLKNLDMSDTSKPDFKDVESKWYNSAINAVVKAGLMKGYPDGTFAPNGKITRAEFAQLIKGIDLANSAELPFTDVAGHWGIGAISQAYANKRIAGYPDNTFRPNNDITRAEAVTILNNLFDRKVDEAGLAGVRGDIVEFKDLSRSHWAYYEIVEASNTHEFYRQKDGEMTEAWVRVLKTWKDFLN